MHFAILGDSLQATLMARALVESGKHTFLAYCPGAIDTLERLWPNHDAKRIGDIEEILADPAVETIIEAEGNMDRLRRALQSERHVICANPQSLGLESAYEAGMIQKDTGRILFPLLTHALHPAYERLAESLRTGGSPGAIRLIRCECRLPSFMCPKSRNGEPVITFPGWNVLRRLGGEIAEVSAFAERENPTSNDTFLVAVRFEKGGLAQVTCIPSEPYGIHLTLTGAHGEQSVDTATMESWNAEAALVALFESALTAYEADGKCDAKSTKPSWEDAVRSLELDDAARRSIEKRRASLLEYQEASEEVGFKGAMTLVGCGLLMGIILLVVLSRWVPWLGWGIIPLLVIFLGMQALRWALPKK